MTETRLSFGGSRRWWDLRVRVMMGMLLVGLEGFVREIVSSFGVVVRSV